MTLAGWVGPFVPRSAQGEAIEGPAPSVDGGNRTFLVIMENVRFLNTTIQADPGENLTLVIMNRDTFSHTFTLFSDANVTPPWDSTSSDGMPAFNQTHAKLMDVIFANVGTQRVNITVPTTIGRYPFVCMITGHWLTMRGFLQVGEEARPIDGPRIDLIQSIMYGTIVFVLLFVAGYHLRGVRARRRER